MRSPSTSARSKRSGQAVVFLLMTLTALAFLLLYNVDLHRIIQRKDQTQNAGDAAALAAARWQGATLNLVGELNLMHALALYARDPEAVNAITNMQARICFTGPLTGLLAAQVAAKKNHIYNDPDMTALLVEHAATVRTLYASTVNGNTYFDEPWTGAWQEYADLLDQIAAEGIAAGPDNAQFFLDPSSGHTLYDKGFYEAIQGQNWCWFYLHARNLLSSYSSYHDWPPLPPTDAADYSNCEIFGVGLHPVSLKIKTIFSPEALSSAIADAGLNNVGAAALSSTNVMDALETWYFYREKDWTAWELIKPDGDNNFPVTGPVREAYDYAGADAVVRVYASVTRLSSNLSGGTTKDKVVWTAAAKPFGYLDVEGEQKRPDSASSFVLPAFHNVRLIPVDAASGADASSSDADWVIHIKKHLPAYLNSGTSALDGSCSYCQALVKWEDQAFRQKGIDWLELNCDQCTVTTGGGGHGGGSRRGH